MREGRRVLGATAPAARTHARVGALAAAGALLSGALLLAGCGGTRVDAHEPTASFNVEVVQASFPAKQSIARPTSLVLQVRNAGAATVPNLAVTVDSFNYVSNVAELSDARRPVWAIEQGPGAAARPPVESVEVSRPGSGQTAYVNTWALGPLAHGQTQTFRWVVTPVKAGTHVVRYAVAAGLSGKARAVLSSGAAARGSFAVTIAGAPPVTYVDPSTGKVHVGTAPKTP